VITTDVPTAPDVGFRFVIVIVLAFNGHLATILLHVIDLKIDS